MCQPFFLFFRWQIERRGMPFHITQLDANYQEKTVKNNLYTLITDKKIIEKIK